MIIGTDAQPVPSTQPGNTFTPLMQHHTTQYTSYTIMVLSWLIAVQLHSFLILCSYGLIIYHDDIVAVEVVYKDLIA